MKVTQWSADVPYKNMQVVTRMTGGLNQIQPANIIGDAQCSNIINLDSIGDEELTPILLHTYDSTLVLGALEFVCAVKYDTLQNGMILTGEYGAPDIASHAIFGSVNIDVTASNFQLDKVHIVIFNQAVKNYFIVQSLLETRIMICDVIDGTVSYVTLPDAYPRCIEVYSNRVFVITGFNKLWWSKAGTYGAAAEDWYGGGSTEDFLTEDAGYWILENEPILYHIVNFNSALYIFSPENIYALTGYSEETFSMARVYSGIGANSYTSFSHPTFSNNKLYFIYSNHVYEMSGGNYPVVIDMPIIMNGEITNGMSGGFDGSILAGLYTDWGLATDSTWGVTSDDNYVYIYNRFMSYVEADTDTNRIYRFDIKHRKWTKISGFSTSSDMFSYSGGCEIIVPSSHPLVWYRQWIGPMNQQIRLYNGTPESSSVYTYVSKAFSIGSFGTNMLKAIWLQYNVPSSADISVYISKQSSGDSDWIQIAQLENVNTTGLVQSTRIIVPTFATMLTQFYRIKIVSNGYAKFYSYTREIRSNMRQ